MVYCVLLKEWNIMNQISDSRRYLNTGLIVFILSFRSENSTSEARKASKSAVFRSVCPQTYLVNWIVHFILQDGLCGFGTQGRLHILYCSSIF